MTKSEKIGVGIIGAALVIGWMIFAARFNGKPAMVPFNPNNPNPGDTIDNYYNQK